VSAEVIAVRNRLFGRSVTTAGLLGGAEVARALRGKGGHDIVLVPATAVREGEGFLDGTRLEMLERIAGAPVVAVGSPLQAAAAVRAWSRGRRVG
jgi:NifB/MoaA-like Fe-S oxidoreductase